MEAPAQVAGPGPLGPWSLGGESTHLPRRRALFKQLARRAGASGGENCWLTCPMRNLIWCLVAICCSFQAVFKLFVGLS